MPIKTYKYLYCLQNFRKDLHYNLNSTLSTIYFDQSSSNVFSLANN